jgi:hypothetical protein
MAPGAHKAVMSPSLTLPELEASSLTSRTPAGPDAESVRSFGGSASASTSVSLASSTTSSAEATSKLAQLDQRLQSRKNASGHGGWIRRSATATSEDIKDNNKRDWALHAEKMAAISGSGGTSRAKSANFSDTGIRQVRTSATSRHISNTREIKFLCLVNLYLVQSSIPNPLPSCLMSQYFSYYTLC